MKFSKEKISDCLEEAKPLLDLHYKELVEFPEIPLDPDFDHYIWMENHRLNRCFVVRDDNGRMVGYSVFTLSPHRHYRSQTVACMDVLFIREDARGCGGHFIKFIDKELKEEGINFLGYSVNAKHNYSIILERMGYRLIDLVFIKKVN